MKKVLNLGFIGGGIDSAIGYTHFIASQMDHRFTLKAGCFSRNKVINEQTASLWCKDVKFNLYENYLQLLDNEIGKLDAICILTPTTTHKQIVIEALERGYAVICEKTLCLDIQEALEIEDVLIKKAGFLAITYNYTGYPMLRELKAMVENGEFGKIHNIQIEMPQEGFIRLNDNQKPTPQQWRLKDSKIPIISLDLGVHCQNIISFLTNKSPRSVFALINTAGWFENIVDDMNILTQYEDGMNVNMWYSKSALGYRNGLKVRIFGTLMSGEWLQMNPEELILNTKNGEKIIKDRASPLQCKIASMSRYNRFKAGHPSGFIEAFGNYYNDIAQSLEDFKTQQTQNSPYVFGIKQALRELRFLESVSKSAKTGENQKIEMAK